MKFVLPFSFFCCLAFPCICYGIHCKVGMYDTAGNAAIVAKECAADQQFCSAIACAIGTEQITVFWACEEQSDHQVLVNRASSFNNNTCRAQIGKKGVNMSNEEFDFRELEKLIN
ncbi:hypothetical protein niasHS_000782 [Heterodera schachtii]|uniref:Uncharacterized protein n=2 Tax=Heterodera TaxID=34509 RepID=A0ABD2LFF9_9BILA